MKILMRCEEHYLHLCSWEQIQRVGGVGGYLPWFPTYFCTVLAVTCHMTQWFFCIQFLYIQKLYVLYVGSELTVCACDWEMEREEREVKVERVTQSGSLEKKSPEILLGLLCTLGCLPDPLLIETERMKEENEWMLKEWERTIWSWQPHEASSALVDWECVLMLSAHHALWQWLTRCIRYLVHGNSIVCLKILKHLKSSLRAFKITFK